MAEFKHQARKQSKSLSAWIREAAYRMLRENEKKDLTEVNALKKFFMECKGRETGQEPDWSEQKMLILEGYYQKVAS